MGVDWGYVWDNAVSCVYKVADFICTVVKDAGFLARLAFISHRRAMSHVLDISPESNAVVAGGGSCIHTSTPPNLTLTIDDLAKGVQLRCNNVNAHSRGQPSEFDESLYRSQRRYACLGGRQSVAEHRLIGNVSRQLLTTQMW